VLLWCGTFDPASSLTTVIIRVRSTSFGAMYFRYVIRPFFMRRILVWTFSHG